MTAAVDQLSRGMQGSANGLREIGSGADDMRAGINGMRDTVDVMLGYLAPARNFVNSTPDCPANAICSLVSRVVEPVDSVLRSTGELSNGAGKLTTGSTTATTPFAGTGGVVTTSGIVFGITMFALAGSAVLSIEQVGITVGVGLLLDTLIVRTFLMPSLVALLGRWFWWPRLPSRLQAGGSARRKYSKSTQLTGRHAEPGQTCRRDLGLPCERAGSRTAWPTTAGDLLATPGIGVGNRGSRDRHRHRDHRRGPEQHRRRQHDWRQGRQCGRAETRRGPGGQVPGGTAGGTEPGTAGRDADGSRSTAAGAQGRR